MYTVHLYTLSNEQVKEQEAALDRAASIFRALGDTPRLRILVRLAQGEACVTDIAEAEGQELSTISQRLRVLRSEGLVRRRRVGKQSLYLLADQHVADLVFNAMAHASEMLHPRPANPLNDPDDQENP